MKKSNNAKSVVVIDTNFLLVPGQFKIDIFDEMKKFSHDFIILSCCLDELKKLAKSRSRKGIYARIALELLEKKDIRKNMKVVKVSGISDLAILAYAKKHDCYVATNDRKLIKMLKKNGINIIRLRQKRYLIME